MKLKTLFAWSEGGNNQAFVQVEHMRTGKMGGSMLRSGTVLAIYETPDGAPTLEVVKALRDMADELESGKSPVHDVTPTIPTAEA